MGFGFEKEILRLWDGLKYLLLLKDENKENYFLFFGLVLRKFFFNGK